MTTLAQRPRTTARSRASGMTGTWRFVRFILRRDRVKLPAWVLGITVFIFYFNSALPTIAPTEEDLAAFSNFATGPVGAILSGPGYGFDTELSYRVFFVGTYGLYFLIAAALMSILLVSRHTRVEEQSGRAELVRASVVGRHAPLTATLLVASGANVALALLLAAATASFGYGALGSLLFGASVGAVGLVFAGLAALTMQVTEYSRAASGMAGAALGVAYLVRAVGDMLTEHGSLLSWFSPLAWSQQTRPFVGERWWPLLLSVALAATTAAVAYTLAARRDLGAGLTAPRRGPARAAGWLRSPLTLALRLQRGSIIGWGIALAILGLTYGALVGPMTDTFADLSEQFMEILGAEEDLLGGYLSFMAVYHVALAAVAGILAVQGVRAEETKGRAEPVLATATGRVQWLGSHLVVAAAGAAGVLLAAGFAFGVGAAISVGDAGLVWDVTAAHLAHIPEVLIFVAVAGLLYGIRPRAVPLAWVLLVYATLVAFFGTLLNLPQAAYNASPLEHIGRMPMADFTPLPVLILSAVAAGAAGVGLWAFRRRDLSSTA